MASMPARVVAALTILWTCTALKALLPLREAITGPKAGTPVRSVVRRFQAPL